MNLSEKVKEIEDQIRDSEHLIKTHQSKVDDEKNRVKLLKKTLKKYNELIEKAEALGGEKV